MSKTKIFYVEDELFLGKIVKESLGSRGYEIFMVEDGANVMALFQECSPDICVLDIMLPNKDGFAIAEEIRETDKKIPILFLTARSQTEDLVKGFKLGRNDYIRKPFSMEELLARIRALLRRVGGDEVLRVNDLELNTATREVKRGKRRLNLTLREYELLEFMARNPRRVLSRDLLLSQVWGQVSGVETNVVDVYVAYLRKKLEAPGEPQLIHTVRGVGYVLRDE